MQQTILYAQWHLVSAMTGHYKSKSCKKMTGKDSDGSYIWKEVSDEYKLESCMNVVKQHIENLREMTEAKIKIMRGEE